MNSIDMWLMDSECCYECGCILNYGEWFMCDDCQQDAWHDEDQDFYDGWFDGYDWDVPVEERVI